MLIEITYAHARHTFYFAIVLHEFARDNVDERGLARAVKPHNAYMFAVVYGKIGFYEQVPIVVSVGKPFYF